MKRQRNKIERQQNENVRELDIHVHGIVQGVGFRPFVHRLAEEFDLAGTVQNQTSGVAIQVRGEPSKLGQFLRRLRREPPAAANIQDIQTRSRFVSDPAARAPSHRAGFRILESQASQAGGPRMPVVPPDLAPCPDCLRELFEASSANRRYAYPFVACTHCGPRYSTIFDLPYDRSRTTMIHFPLCDACQQEYLQPDDRRFHAQATACPDCGPQLSFENHEGAKLAQGDDALSRAVRSLAGVDGETGILALKGVGGFQLLVEAAHSRAVARLRRRKRRPHKAFALLYENLTELRKDCQVSTQEARLLEGPAAPIVLLRRRLCESSDRAHPRIARQVAPDNPYLGAMLPASPLHALICRRFAELTGRPPVFVATSGNAAGEPMCITDDEARERLGHIADNFLTHNRPIVRALDDSIFQVVDGQAMTLRRGRGLPPYTVQLISPAPRKALGVVAAGAQLKNTVAVVNRAGVAIQSPHIGDLENLPAFEAHLRAREDLCSFYEVRPELFAADGHPDYRSTISARAAAESSGSNSPPGQFYSVQHHHAHALAACVEHGLKPDEVVAVVFDGMGLGGMGLGMELTSGSKPVSGNGARLWGGEILLPGSAGNTLQSFRRFAHLREFPLPGGEAAAREPRRAALGLLYAMYGDALFNKEGSRGNAVARLLRWFRADELESLRVMLNRKWNCPQTSSAGRLFDAVAALTGIHEMRSSFEGHAAMNLEFAALAQFERETANESEAGRPIAGTAGEPTNTRARTHKPFLISGSDPLVLDWEPLLRTILAEPGESRSSRPAQAARERIALRFHQGLARAILASVARARETTGRSTIVLCGGCFQNRLLLTLGRALLAQAGLRVYVPEQLPPGDGGIAIGQAAAAYESAFSREATANTALPDDALNSVYTQASSPHTGNRNVSCGTRKD